MIVLGLKVVIISQVAIQINTMLFIVPSDQFLQLKRQNIE